MRQVIVLGLLCASVVASAGPREDRAKKKQHQEATEHLQKGVDLMSGGQFDDALLEFQSADALEPSAEVAQHIGECHEALGHVDEAVASYQRYLQEAPKAADAEAVKKHIGELQAGQHTEAARKHVAEKRYEEAIKEFETSMAAKADPKLWGEIGNAQELMGDTKKAIESYQRYLKEVPEASDAGEIEGRISVLSGKKMMGPPPPPAPPPPPPRKPFYTSKLGLGLAGGGLLVALGGAISLGVAGAASGAADRATTEADFYSNNDRSHTMSTVGIVLLGTGVAALLASAVVLYLHTRPPVVEDQGQQPQQPDQRQFVPTGWLRVPRVPMTSPFAFGETP